MRLVKKGLKPKSRKGTCNKCGAKFTVEERELRKVGSGFATKKCTECGGRVSFRPWQRDEFFDQRDRDLSPGFGPRSEDC